jgi:hypothetical protein
LAGRGVYDFSLITCTTFIANMQGMPQNTAILRLEEDTTSKND